MIEQVHAKKLHNRSKILTPASFVLRSQQGLQAGERPYRSDVVNRRGVASPPAGGTRPDFSCTPQSQPARLGLTASLYGNQMVASPSITRDFI